MGSPTRRINHDKTIVTNAHMDSAKFSDNDYHMHKHGPHPVRHLAHSAEVAMNLSKNARGKELATNQRRGHKRVQCTLSHEHHTD